MNLHLEIKELFFTKENEKLTRSEKLEKLSDLINKSNKDVYADGWKQGALDYKEQINKLFKERINKIDI